VAVSREIYALNAGGNGYNELQETTSMHHLLRTSILALVAGCVVFLQQLGPPLDAQTVDPKAQGNTSKSTGDAKDPSGKKVPLDKFTMPPGGVVILVEEAKDPRGFFPRMIIMTPEKHQELMDRIAHLEKQLKVDRKAPHACKLSATVEGDRVRVFADLHFHSDQPRTTVWLGFRGAELSEAKIRPQGGDAPWQPAIVEVGAEGYQVRADKAGDYQMIVELRVPLASNIPGSPAPGAERSFDLALPGAAVTTLTLDLPDAVKELRWNKNNVEKALAPATEQKRWEVAVGKVTQLQVTWKEPLAPGGTTPLRTVRGQIAVRVDEAQVVTTAELTLTDLRGKAKEWRLWLPPQAKAKVVAPEGLAFKLAPVNQYLHVLTLATPTTDPVKVAVTVTTLRPANAKIPVGPFSVQDAVRQEGTIEVKLPPEVRRGLRLTYHVAGSLEEREPPRDQPGSEVVAVFKYWDMPTPPKGTAGGALAKVLVPPLEIERRTIQGKVETHVEHNLRLHQDERGWQIVATCKILARPLDTPVDSLDVQLPRLPAEAWPLLMEPSAAMFPGGLPWAAWGLASQLPLDGEWVLATTVGTAVGPAAAAVELQYPDAAAKDQRKPRIKWYPAQAKELTVTLVGTYALPAGMQKVHLELPRPVAILDRGAKAQMEVGDTLELLTQDGGPELPVPQKHVVTRSWERAPIYWDLAWRAHRPEFPVHVTTDIEFRPRYAQVKQQLAWDQADRPRGAALLRLRVPPEARSLKVSGGGKLVALDREKHLASVDVVAAHLPPGESPGANLAAPTVAGKSRVVLEYDFALPAPVEGKVAAPPIRVPLIWPEQATNVDTKLRLWTQPGIQPVVAETSLGDLTWKDAGTEVVPGQDSLPVRVLLGEGQYLPLLLRWETAPAKLPTAVIDRVLAQVNVNDEGTVDYRSRFLLTKLHAASVEVRMPLPLASVAPQFLLDGKAAAWQPRDSDALVAKLNVDPSLYGKSVILEVSYQLPRGQPAKESPWQTTLNPPTLEGDAFLGKVRWQVTLPPSMLAVAARGDATTEHVWQWRGWLPSLEPGISSHELELWLTGQDLAEAGGEASLVSLGSSLEPLRIFRVNKALWFLICSGTVLLAGLALCLHPPSPAGWLAVVVLVFSAAAAGGWLWPALLAAAFYGAAPGLLVTAMLWLSQWLLHERYKRQLVFMPGFTRIKGGSSLIRSTSNQRGREPSTIDAPPALEKSDAGLKQ